MRGAAKKREWQVQRPGGHKKGDAPPELDAPDQKEFAFPRKKHPDPCGAEEEFSQQQEVWSPENGFGKRRKRLW